MRYEQNPNAFTIPVRIYYEDTDAGGVVYYANYLKYLERCRTEWLREIGHDQADLLRDPGIAFVVRSVSLEYLKPARLDDLLNSNPSYVFFREVPAKGNVNEGPQGAFARSPQGRQPRLRAQ